MVRIRSVFLILSCLGGALPALSAAGLPAPARLEGVEEYPRIAHLWWTPVPGASVYEVLIRQEDGRWLPWEDRHVDPWAYVPIQRPRVEFAVRALNASAVGEPSPAVAVAVRTVWAGPLQVTQAGAGLEARWQPDPEAKAYKVVRYSLMGAGVPVERLLGPEVLSVRDEDLLSGVRYYYAVQSIRPTPGIREDFVTASQVTKGTRPAKPVYAPPAPPAGPAPKLRGTSGPGHVWLDWGAVGGDWSLWRGTSPDALTLVDSGLPGPTYYDVEVEPGRKYYYAVERADGAGRAVRSDTVVLTAQAPGQRSWEGWVVYQTPHSPPQKMYLRIPDADRKVEGIFLLTGWRHQELAGLVAAADGFNMAVLENSAYNFGDSPVRRYQLPETEVINQADHRWSELSTRNLAAALGAAVRQSGHPELATAPILTFGFSKATYDNQVVLDRPEWKDRVIGAINQGGLGFATSPLLSRVPSLYMATSAKDRYSSLRARVEGEPKNYLQSLYLPWTENFATTWDTYTRSVATWNGGPLTVLNALGAIHGDGRDNPVAAAWIRSLLSQRLPWKGSADPVRYGPALAGWRATYDVTLVSPNPWDRFLKPSVRLENPKIFPAIGATDQSLFTWLPSRRFAEAWKDYTEKSRNVPGF